MGLSRLKADSSIAIGIFVITLSIFLISKIHQVADSAYSMLVSDSLLTRGTFTLDHYSIPRREPTWNGYYFKHGPIYQLERIDNHVYYHFPPGTPVLSVPFVAAFKLLGVSAANADGTYNPKGEVKIQAGIAALLMAVLAAVFFFTARLLLPKHLAAVVALGGALGTQVYSTASRALWSETWGILLLAVVIYLLVAAEIRRYEFKPWLIATVLAWAYFVRPTFAVPILAITVYVFTFYRAQFLKYILTGVVWLLLFVGYSWIHFRQILPSYYRANRLQFDLFWTALTGNLISPSRGLLVYVPVLFFVAYSLIRYRRGLELRSMVWLSLAVAITHLIVISGFNHWWGGHSFGPRFTTGLVPWFVLLAILALRARLNAQAQQTDRANKLELAFGGLLLLISAFIHTVGATSHAAWLWNQRPRGVDEHPERLWDWREPQFLAAYLPYPPPSYPMVSQNTRIDFLDRNAADYFWFGWNEGAPDARWSERNAAIAFSLRQFKPGLIRMSVTPYVVSGKLDVQTLTIQFNNRQVGSFTLASPDAQQISIPVPSEAVQERNVLTFEVPNAQAPLVLGAGEDPRWRGIRINWMEFQ